MDLVSHYRQKETGLQTGDTGADLLPAPIPYRAVPRDLGGNIFHTLILPQPGGSSIASHLPVNSEHISAAPDRMGLPGVQELQHYVEKPCST